MATVGAWATNGQGQHPHPEVPVCCSLIFLWCTVHHVAGLSPAGRDIRRGDRKGMSPGIVIQLEKLERPVEQSRERVLGRGLLGELQPAHHDSLAAQP